MNDFGFGAAIILRVSQRGQDSTNQVHEAAAHAARRTGQIALVTACASLTLYLLGVYRELFAGLAVRHFATAFLLGSCVWALTIPASLGFRLLIAYNRTVVAQMLQAVVAPVNLGLVVIATWTVNSVVPLAVAPFIAQFGAGLAAWRFAEGYGAPLLSSVLRSAVLGKYDAGRLSGYTRSAAIVSNASPIAYQCDRFLIARYLDIGQVGNYSSVSQVYQALYSVLTSGGQSLWPWFLAGAADSGVERRRRLRVAIWSFLALGAALGALCFITGPIIAKIVTRGAATSTTSLSIAFGVLLVVQGLTTPLANALTTPAGFRFQSRLYLILVPANVGLSVAWLRSFGVTGPIWASTLTTAVIVTLPCLWWVRHSLS